MPQNCGVRRFLLLLALTVPAYAKSLHWDALDVTAHLNADGTLHVRERQAMVFDGDWNGGERTFRTRLNQKLTLNSISRLDDSGRQIPLQQGDLKQVDQYKFVQGNVLRWRSRMPGDPPFDNRRIVYVLDYTLRNVLRETGERHYLLDNDFAFPDREGNIDRFTLDLTFDPVWNTAPIHLEQANLAPGSSYVVTRDLTFSGSGEPVAFVPTPSWVGPACAAIIAIAMVILGGMFFAAERPTGRFEAPSSTQPVNELWLRTHLFSMKPEVAGAAWDGQTGPPEVAAVLARLTGEGKITSRVDKKTLHMHLNQPLSSFTGYEKHLLEGMFFDGVDTDTNRIKKHYASRGFDPAKLISTGIDKQLDGLPDRKKRVKRFDWRILLVILGAAVLVVGAALLHGAADLVAMAVAGGLTLFFTAAASGAASYHSSALTGIGWRLFVVAMLFSPGVIATIVVCALATKVGVGPITLAALALLVIVCWKTVLDALKIRDSPQYIAFRRQLLAARNYFVAQLGSPQPQLHDDWLPYLLAFGLGTNVDRWFRSFGDHHTSTSTFGSSSHPSPSTSTASSGWTGGGGAFGGAGATGSWALAAGALAAGVASPSSSGSGGGGGGGSSGGGGGGGW